MDLKKQGFKFFGLLLIFLGVGLVLGYETSYQVLTKKDKALFDSIRPVRLNSDNFKFVNPLLGYSIPSSKEFEEFKPLNSKIVDYINNQTKLTNSSKISVYFRDLNKGRWIGINENEKYDPASMLKVVIMVAFYKEAENNPAILTKKIDYNKSLDEIIKDVPYQTPSTLQVGQTYSIDDLIEKMIVNSDNGAKNALLANIDNSSLRDVYTDLGIEPPTDSDNSYTISAKAYSSFFRILYNATYLTPALSEKALNLLSRAEFKEGLVAGVPTGIKVSQKFGEHVNTDNSGQATSTELHDCGIVYLPSNPYALCVMTEGQDINNLEKIIRDISSLVYKNVSSNYEK